MKNFKKLMVGGLILFTIAACKKDKNGGDGGTAAEGTVKAKIGGSSWTSISMSTSAQYVAAGKVLTLMGVDASGKTINIIVNNYDGSTGTWEIPNGLGGIAVTASYIEVNLGGSSKTYVAPYSGSGLIGKVQISEFSKTGSVKGTFNFKARNQSDNSDFKEVTEGSFNIKVKSF
ncbi:hypothetical protein D9M68_425150 [compost metagenome]